MLNSGLLIAKLEYNHIGVSKMLKLAAKLFAAFIVVAGLAQSPAANAGAVDPSLNGDNCCGGYLRGYWFVAPTDFNIDSIWLNTANGLSTSFQLQVMKFNNNPPEYSGSTTSFTTLGYFTSASGILSVNYSFNVNDIIGFLAVDNNLNTTPYSSARLQNIDGLSVTLNRLVRQSSGASDPVSSEITAGNLGAIGFSYNTNVNAVSAPGSLALLMVGSVLLGFARRRNV